MQNYEYFVIYATNGILLNNKVLLLVDFEYDDAELIVFYWHY